MCLRKHLIILIFMILPMVQERAIAEEQAFTIGVELLEYYPQYSYDTVYGYRGVYKEILDLFSAKSGYKFHYQALPIKRLYKEFLRDNLDFKYPDNVNWKSELKKNMDIEYSDPVASYTDGVIVLPERKGLGVSKLRKLAIPRGFTPVDYLDLINDHKIEVIESNGFQETIKLVLTKVVDGAYVNTSVAEYQMNSIINIPGALVFDPDLPHTKDSYRLSTTKNRHIILEFNQFLKDSRREIGDIKLRYSVE